jgi:hypothetical protein
MVKRRRPPLKRVDRIAFILIAAIVVYQSMIPPVVGLGNNGDFGKISGHFSMGYPPNIEHRYAPLKMQFEPRYEYHAEFRSTENLLAIAAVRVSSIVSKTGDFDMRCIGAIHAALFLLAIWLLLPVLAFFFSPFVRLLILFAIAVVLCDVMYVAVFNSFYMDASALVFLPLTAVLFLRSFLWQRRGDLIGLAICAALLAGAKPQHAILALPIAALLIAYRKRLGSPAGVWMAVAGVIGAASYTAVAAPGDYRSNQWYDVIFLGILPYSPAPTQDLLELGLDPSYVAYSRTSAYYANSGFSNPEFTKTFHQRASGASVMRFYSRHPARAFQLLIRGFDDAGGTRPNLGNFDPGEGLPPLARSRAFAFWSGFREWIFSRHGLRYFWVTIALQALLLLRSRRPWLTAPICLSIAVLLAAAIAGLADAAEAPRHFTVFCELEDVSLIALLSTLLPRRTKL